MRDDIPLQTEPGNYRPSWLRKNRWWLLAIVGLVGAMLIGSVISTSLARPSPATLTLDIVASDDLPLRVRPDKLHHAVSVRDKTSTREFSLTNTSASTVHTFFSIAARGTADYRGGNLEFINLAAPGVDSMDKHQGSIALTDDTQSIRFKLESVSGLSGDNTIAGNATAVFRLSATNTVDQKDTEHFLLLLISVSPR